MTKYTRMPKTYKKELNILQQDEQIIILDKPAGLLTLPDRYDTTLPNIYHMLVQKYTQIYPVHRLDKWTSGLLLFAKDKESHKVLNQDFAQRKVIKKYTAIVQGGRVPDHCTIDQPIRNKPGKVGIMEVHPDGKPSITECKTIQHFGPFSLIELQIYSGRQHQIRVHLQFTGYPLMVDAIYSPSKAFYLSSIKKKYKNSKGRTERPLLARSSLHAHQLQFVHPITRKSIVARADLPKDMAATIYQLNKIYPL